MKSENFELLTEIWSYPSVAGLRTTPSTGPIFIAPKETPIPIKTKIKIWMKI